MGIEHKTFQEILLARENRALRQKQLIERFRTPLVSFTLNIPGPVKDSMLYQRVHQEGVKALIKVLAEKGAKIVYQEVNYKSTGAEAFINVDTDGLLLKRITTGIEGSHSIGRLFDMDVIDEQFNLITRNQMGLPGRKCLLCNDDASVCSRSRKHDISKLILKIERIANEYFRDNS